MSKSLIKRLPASSQQWLNELPTVLEDRAMACARSLCVPPELPALVAIGGISAALGKGLVVQSGRNRTTRANLFILLGASSGAGKSEVFRELYRPILAFEDGLHSWWGEEAAPRARAGEELLKGVISGLRSAGRRMGHPGLELFRRIQKYERKRDICRSFLNPPSLLADDITPEAQMALMERSNETIAIVSPDARHILKGLEVSNSKVESVFLKGFSGDLALSSRISRRSIRLRSPCLTVLLLTQCDAFQRFIGNISKSGSGLLPRFLCVNLDAKSEVPRAVDIRRMRSIEKVYDRLIQELLETFRFAEEPTVVTPSREALRFLRDYELECRAKSEADSSIRSEILRRKAEQAWRIALVLHAGRHGRLAAENELSFGDAESAMFLLDWLEEKGYH